MRNDLSFNQYPVKTVAALKQTNVLMNELELKRFEEAKFRLTTFEQEQYIQLKEIFKCIHPAEELEQALEEAQDLKTLQKDYVTAVKIEKDKEENKKSLESDSSGLLILSSGMPIILLGLSLMSTFKIAGIVILTTGIAMYFPLFILEVTKKRRARKELNIISKQVEDLQFDITRKHKKVDDICSKYGVPINDLNEEKHISDILEAAKVYESLVQKQTDYELLMTMNNSNALSDQIAKNLYTISGIVPKNEDEYRQIINKLEDQLV